MAYITPNTWITLCKNVPLDASYDHNITFANVNAQKSYFIAHRFVELSANSYQRTMSNRIRIACTMEQAVQCNYLYFSNDSFENKWFYAFITGWEYINNVTTEITYQIDVMQTFLFDMQLKSCFVEREHIYNDYVGANTIPETLEQGEYVVNGDAEIEPPINDLTKASILLLTTFTYDPTTGDFDKFTGGVASGVYTGLNVIKFDNTQDFQTFLQRAQSWQAGDQTSGIIACFMCPGSPNTYDTTHNVQQFNKKQSGYLGTPTDPYQPRNNKLYTFPYNILRVSTDSETAEFRYEDFQGSYVQFYTSFTLIPEPVFVAVPYQYKGTTQQKNERITVQKYPQCAFDADVYKVYLAQNTGSLAVGAISAVQHNVIAPLLKTAAFTMTGGLSSAAGGLDSSSFGGAAGNIAGLLGNSSLSKNVAPSTIKSVVGNTEVHVDIGDGSLLGVAKSLGQLFDISRKPPQMNGTQSALADYALGYKRMRIDYLTIKAEYARIIDDFFTMFGYATHRVKTPNVWGRKYFNYVQTKGCILEGNMPEPFKQELIKIFNRGTTFWHTENLSLTENIDNIIGDYTVNNVSV